MPAGCVPDFEGVVGRGGQNPPAVFRPRAAQDGVLVARLYYDSLCGVREAVPRKAAGATADSEP